MNTDAAVAAEAFRRGASAYFPKTAAASELITAIREVLAGRSYLSPLITRETVDFLITHREALASGDRKRGNQEWYGPRLDAFPKWFAEVLCGHPNAVIRGMV